MFIRVHDKYGDGFRKKWKYIISSTVTITMIVGVRIQRGAVGN